MASRLLSVENLRVQYGRFLAVDNISFALSGGDLLGLIGPNGAGKTTTLRAIAGLTPPSTGRIDVMGYDPGKHVTDFGRHLGFAPDGPQAYDTLTVEDFLRFIGRAYRVSREMLEERIDHWLEALWLSEKRKAKVSSLSKGMRQRLTVARTLLPDPHVILLDEPAGGLDPAGRIQFRRLLASLRDQGKAIIVSSHILADLAEYCTHIAIVERGRFLSFGTVAQVAGAGGETRSNYRIGFAHRVGDLNQRLAMIGELNLISSDPEAIVVEWDTDRERAAELLAKLINAGLPVAEFRALRPDLEQAYLRSGIGQVD
ncbi:MAG: ABC transporter ATP-binding protein [Phycisphaerales bacterium]|nr:ABC transporter ATP-binding protein [Phycisphaerales bacterium]